jgi:hypothetical protein
VSNFNTPGNAGFRDFPPGPHSGVPTDPDSQVAPDSLDRSIRTVIRSRWTWIVLVCIVLAIGVFLSVH